MNSERNVGPASRVFQIALFATAHLMGCTAEEPTGGEVVDLVAANERQLLMQLFQSGHRPSNCGFEVCGTDRVKYRCGPSGWQRRDIPCPSP